jgi:hypothetical protein
MPSYVVKAARDEDLYLIWSTVVDCATYVGTRAEIAEHLWSEHRRGHPDCDPKPGSGPDARMARADKTGSSVLEPAGAYGWDDAAFMVMEAAPHDDHWYELPRANLAAYARALLADDEPAAHALLRRIPDEDEDEDGRAGGGE